MPDYEIRIRVTGEEEQAAAAVFRLRTEYLPAAGFIVDEPRLVNPPGSSIEQLPAEVLAAHPRRPYTSTACMDAVWYDTPDLHERCRLREKFTGEPCRCRCHEAGGEAGP